ncbi:MAG: 2-haloacid dehalogenase [Spirochaetes bacterium]|nr:MAG: 2-haloacid dehalogenase [Spirochaetota bacterium]
MTKRYSAVLMDADETLFDFTRAEFFALEASFRAYSLDPSPATIALYDEINRALWRKFERGEIAQEVLKVQRFERLFTELGVSVPAAAFSEAYIETLGRGAFLIPGAEELCAYLAAKYPLALVTNGLAKVQRPRFEASSIRRHFRALVISEEVGIAKPAPEIFWRACEALGSDAKDCIMIGDSLASDIAGAAGCDMDSCWVNLRGAVNDTGIEPTFEVRSLAEIREIL